METPRLTPKNRLALLMHGAVAAPLGKMGFGLMRYSAAPVVAVIDREQVGQSLPDLTGIPCDAPIVGSLRDALAYRPDTLVPAIAPPGGVLPPDWWEEVREGLAAGLSLVNGLHRPLAADPKLAPLVQPGCFIWDIRQEPPGLTAPGRGRAREATARRVLVVGTDMGNGKMTAAIEMDRAARARGIRSRFLATGQIGIAIAGDGVALDAVRLDYATGAVEQLVLRNAPDADVLFVEGQGSLVHPASTATLALLRGAMPTELVLVHRAGRETLPRDPWVRIPPLRDVVALYESVSSAAGALPGARVAGIALNCRRLSDDEARRAIEETEAAVGLPATDVVRFGAGKLVDALGL